MSAKADLINPGDVNDLRNAMQVLNDLLEKLPKTPHLNQEGFRVCGYAADARNALRNLMREHDEGTLTVESLPRLVSESPSLPASKSGKGVAA